MVIFRNELENYPVIGSGGQGKVYLISSNTVAKQLENIGILDLFKIIKKLHLNQFVNPLEEIYDENGSIYLMSYPYIDTIEYKNILQLEKKHLIDNINVLLDDISILSEAGILIRDLIPKNSLCLNNKIYIIDFGLYELANNNLKQEIILKLNIEKFQQYFNKLWIMALVNIGYDRRNLKYHPEYFENDYISSIYYDFEIDDNILTYVKRK